MEPSQARTTGDRPAACSAPTAQGAVVGVSALAAVQGLWQRSERWVFAAGLGVNLAVSLVLWRDHANVPLGEWWLPLLQANVIASAGAALL